MNYRLLDLDPNSRHMSLPVLRAIYHLVDQGAIIVGPKPVEDPSLADNGPEFLRLSDKLFGDGTGTHDIGKGTVFAGQDVSTVLQELKIPPDFDYTKPESDSDLEFVHRKLAIGDLYFVDNRRNRYEAVSATFRVAGRAAEVWRAEDGSKRPASFKMAVGHTTVPLLLEPWGAAFVIFQKPTTAASRTIPAKAATDLVRFDGEWTVSFQLGRGAPQSVKLQQLESWTRNSNPGIKYFSGIATYSKSFEASGQWLMNGAQVWLDLGDVRNLAEVTVDGKPLGVVWHVPYRVDLTSVLKPGHHELSIKVANGWVNRLIGDRQLGVTAPISFTDVQPYKADSALLDSGLLGPVRIVREDDIRD